MRLQLRPRDDCLNVAMRLAGGNVHVILELRQEHIALNAHIDIAHLRWHCSHA